MSLPTGDQEVLFLSNPSCSKSRAVHALLALRGIAFEERNYLEAPLDLAELRELARRLGRTPSEWIRIREQAYAAAGLGPDSSDEAVLAAIAARPVLLERPIVVRASRARVGRPPEAVLELFE